MGWIGATIGTERRFRVLGALGTTVLGRAFKARDLRRDSLFTLEVVDAELADTPRFAERLEREILLQVDLSNPGLTPIAGYLLWEGAIVVLRRFARGRALVDVLTPPTGGKLAPQCALGLFERVLAAMLPAHQIGLCHLGLSAESIAIHVERGHLVPAIVDFGAARLVEATRFAERFPDSSYIAPEQRVGSGELGPHTDVYALGTILRAMLLGERVRHDTTQPAKEQLLGSGGRTLSERLLELVRRATAPDPNDRFADAGEFLRALPGLGPLARTTREIVPTEPSAPPPSDPTSPEKQPEPWPRLADDEDTGEILVEDLSAALAASADSPDDVATATGSDSLPEEGTCAAGADGGDDHREAEREALAVSDASDPSEEDRQATVRTAAHWQPTEPLAGREATGGGDSEAGAPDDANDNDDSPASGGTPAARPDSSTPQTPFDLRVPPSAQIRRWPAGAKGPLWRRDETTQRWLPSLLNKGDGVTPPGPTATRSSARRPSAPRSANPTRESSGARGAVAALTDGLSDRTDLSDLAPLAIAELSDAYSSLAHVAPSSRPSFGMLLLLPIAAAAFAVAGTWIVQAIGGSSEYVEAVGEKQATNAESELAIGPVESGDARLPRTASLAPTTLGAAPSSGQALASPPSGTDGDGAPSTAAAGGADSPQPSPTAETPDHSIPDDPNPLDASSTASPGETAPPVHLSDEMLAATRQPTSRQFGPTLWSVGNAWIFQRHADAVGDLGPIDYYVRRQITDVAPHEWGHLVSLVEEGGSEPPRRWRVLVTASCLIDPESERILFCLPLAGEDLEVRTVVDTHMEAFQVVADGRSTVFDPAHGWIQETLADADGRLIRSQLVGYQIGGRSAGEFDRHPPTCAFSGVYARGPGIGRTDGPRGYRAELRQAVAWGVEGRLRRLDVPLSGEHGYTVLRAWYSRHETAYRLSTRPPAEGVEIDPARPARVIDLPLDRVAVWTPSTGSADHLFLVFQKDEAISLEWLGVTADGTASETLLPPTEMTAGSVDIALVPRAADCALQLRSGAGTSAQEALFELTTDGPVRVRGSL